ncbi:MAG: helix-turn-helix domain-containing protein, partial [Aeromonas sp.]
RSLLLGKPPAEYWLTSNGATAQIKEEGYPLGWPLAEVERAHILQVVASHEGNKSAASRVLGVARKTLERKFKEWAIE